MVNLKNILIVSAVSLLSVATFAITKITGQKHIASVQTEKTQKTPEDDGEIATNDDPWREIEKVVAAYYSKEGINYHGSMKLLDESGDKEKMLEQMNFEYSLLGDEFYYKMGEFECVSKDNLLMVIDNQSKSISVSRQTPQSQSTQQSSVFSPDAFKKILEQKSANVRVTQEGDEKIITVDSIQDASVQGYRIYYNPISYRVKKLEIGMVRLNSINGGEESSESVAKSDDTGSDSEASMYTYFLEVNYDEVRPLSLKREDFHPENKFIKISQNNIQLTPAYSSYSLINAGE